MKLNNSKLIYKTITAYKEQNKKFGFSSKGVFWQNDNTQIARFNSLINGILTQDLDGGISISDFGCGYGAFYNYIKNKKFMKDCWLWLYRGAWQEWEIEEIDMAIPMSPAQVVQKRNSILCHQSQKDKVMFQGNDEREFWLRAEERNKNTANLYNKLGLAEYQAIEAFKRFYY